MKIIETGKSEAKTWWIGQVLICPNCGRKVELEKGDDEGDRGLQTGPDAVQYVCETCKKLIQHDNPATVAARQVLVTETPKTIPVTQPMAVPPVDTTQGGNPRAARVGNNVSQGYSDPFQGTSWGAGK